MFCSGLADQCYLIVLLIVMFVRSEKLCDIITLSIAEISPADEGDYECQVSFSTKISRRDQRLETLHLTVESSNID